MGVPCLYAKHMNLSPPHPRTVDPAQGWMGYEESSKKRRDKRKPRHGTPPPGLSVSLAGLVSLLDPPTCRRPNSRPLTLFRAVSGFRRPLSCRGYDGDQRPLRRPARFQDPTSCHRGGIPPGGPHPALLEDGHRHRFHRLHQECIDSIQQDRVRVKGNLVLSRKNPP